MILALPKMTVTIHAEGDDRVIVLDASSITSREASVRESQAAYIGALVRGHLQVARELADLASESFARDTRNEERRS